MTYGFKEFAAEVLKALNKPLSKVDIWNEGVKLGLDKKINSKGQTPWQSISAQIYSEIKNKKEQSRFKQVSKNPTLFALTNQAISDKDINNAIIKTETDKDKSSNEKYERKLHPVLVKYLYSNQYFSCLTKTIMHEISSRTKKHVNYWVHPDLIGIHFPFDDYDPTTLSSIKILNEKTYKIFSFEMKVNINLSNLREYFFQAVSNSSWAHEGYLVAPNISEDDEFLNELSILNNAFGIGVIKLNIDIPEQSEILFYSKKRDNLDINMLDKLISINTNVRDIFTSIEDSNRLSRLVGEEIFDPIIDDEDYEKYKLDNFQNSK